jgi:hypothetical protein
VRMRTLVVAPVLVLFGVSACSSGTATTTTVEAVGTPVTTIAAVASTGLDGVEFIIHQAPG